MRLTSPLTVNAALVIGISLLSGKDAAAQSLGVTPGRDMPQWIDAWSPLALQADLPRRLPSASTAMPLLLLPATRVGLFWTGGNPAALVGDVGDRRADVAVSAANQDGDYRRPLDPARASLTRLDGMAWQPLTPRGAVIGRMVFDRKMRDPASVSDVNESYPSSPFVLTDTTRPALRTTRARLEGAGGWRIGEWGFGTALGYDTRTTATVNARLARFNRQVIPAAKVGVVRAFAGNRWHAGLHATWRGKEENINVVEVREDGAVYELAGYQEVPLLGLIGGHFRRVTEELRSGGVAVGGAWREARWTAYVDGSRLRERIARQQFQDDPPTDLWVADGKTGGGALQIPLMGGRSLLSVQGKFASLTGRAEQVNPSRTGINASERVIEGNAELRLNPTAGRWAGVLTVSVLVEHRTRSDSVAQAVTTVDGITPRAALEIGRLVSDRLLLTAGYAVAGYSASGEIPAAASRGPLYRRVFAPELEMATSGALTQALSASTRWRVRELTSVWIAGRIERLSPSVGAGTSFAPGGDRVARSIWLGVTLSDGDLLARR